MLSRVISTRAGAIVVALLLAAVAVAVVVIYAGNYRSSVKDSTGQVPVLVATRQIDQFTPGEQVVDGSMFRTQTVLPPFVMYRFSTRKSGTSPASMRFPRARLTSLSSG